MRAVVIPSIGGPEVLRVIETERPEPGPGRLRIKVVAAALNPVDAASREGVFGPVPEGGYVGTGWDVAGTVDAVGPGAEAFAPGDRVVGLSHGWEPLKTHAEYVVLDGSAVAPAPTTVDLTHASTLPLNALTADQGLALLGLAAGDTLLVTGAAGAVGGYAVQLAKEAGLTVTALASAADEELVRAFGADRFVARDGGGNLAPVDGVLDAAVIGAAALAYVRDGGAYAGVIPNTVPPAERGVRVEVVEVKADGARLAELAALVDRGVLTTRVAETYPLERAAQAHARLAKGGVRGRLVLTP